MVQDTKSYQEALDWIHGLGRFGIKPGLQRITVLLEMLGNPHLKIPFVHIGGTNGKGSTAAILASILRSEGYRIGLYTSPYLLSFTNRMAVNGSDISPGELALLVDEVRPLVERISENPELGHPTEFEVVTVLALTYFARSQVDLVVLEVGLGGRLDATNIVTPLLSIITNVSLEHTDVLGHTVEEIALEKAGIIKEKIPVFTATSDDRVYSVIKSRAEELNSSVFFLSLPNKKGITPDNRPTFSEVKVLKKGQSFTYHGFSNIFMELFIPLRGYYQVINASTALAALELIADQGFEVTEDSIRRGLKTVCWPGRLELLNEKPKLVMDGAHNPEAIRQLVKAVPDYFQYRHLILVFGVMADKDMHEMLVNLLPLSHKIVFTRPIIPRAAEPHVPAHTAVHELGFEREIFIINDLGDSLKKALQLAGEDDLILVTGSFYTVSDARAYWFENRMTEKFKMC